MEINWQYSRNQRRHWAEDGEYYGKSHARLFEIKDCVPYGQYHRAHHGYDLMHKGKKIGHAKTVKELKQQARDCDLKKNKRKSESISELPSRLA